MRKIIFFLITSLVYCADAFARDLTQPEKLAIESSVKETLKDPDSAQFTFGQYLDNRDKIYCGFVNAKNSFGGYTGKEIFSVMLTEAGKDNFIALPVNQGRGSQNSTLAMCAQAGYPVMVPKHLVKIVNEQRKSNGLKPLTKSQILD